MRFIDRRGFVVRLAAGLAGAPLLAHAAWAQLVNKTADQLRNGEFNWHPERSPDGPVILACKHQSSWETLAFHRLLQPVEGGL